MMLLKLARGLFEEMQHPMRNKCRKREWMPAEIPLPTLMHGYAIFPIKCGRETYRCTGFVD